MAKELWKGNEAIAQAAIRAGCDCFFGYPITPQNGTPDYLPPNAPNGARFFAQCAPGVPPTTMVSGPPPPGRGPRPPPSPPGVGLRRGGIGSRAGAGLPAVIVNVMRGGPGLGSIQPSQADYYQATRGGGNGDYRTIVLAPCNIQEAVDLTQEAFDLADCYRNPVVVLADGMIGQMMEPIEWHDIPKRELPPKDWAASGRNGRAHNNFVTSLFIEAQACEEHDLAIQAKYDLIEEREIRWEEKNTQDCQVLLVAYGTPSRIAMSAIEQLAERGVKAGLFRPITLWPFPYAALKKAASQASVQAVLTVEMSLGQMVDDVRLAVEGEKPVYFEGRAGGSIPTLTQIVDAAERALKGGK